MSDSGKICHKCGFLRPFSEYRKHRHGYINVCNKCKPLRKPKGKTQAPTTNKKLIQLNADLILLCEEYKREVESLKQHVVNLETRLETYQIKDQEQLLGSLRSNLELERQTEREA